MPLQSDTSITKNPSVDAHPTAGWQGGSLGGLRLTRVHGILGVATAVDDLPLRKRSSSIRCARIWGLLKLDHFRPERCAGPAGAGGSVWLERPAPAHPPPAAVPAVGGALISAIVVPSGCRRNRLEATVRQSPGGSGRYLR